MARIFRRERSTWVIFWVFAVPIGVLVGVLVATYPPVGVPLAVVTAALLAWQVRWNRVEGRRLAAREPELTDGELLEAYRAFRLEPGRMPDGHGPGDPEVTLVVDRPVPDLGDLGDLTLPTRGTASAERTEPDPAYSTVEPEIRGDPERPR